MRSSRGATIVEAAFVTPVFLVLMMAVMEGGLYMKNDLAVANTVRAGARTASAAGRTERADLYILLNISREAAAINTSEINRVVIYRPSINPLSAGQPPSPACQAGTPVAGECNVYTPSDFAKAAAQVQEESAQEQAIADSQANNTPLTRTLDKNKIWFGCLENDAMSTWPHAGQSPDRYWCPSEREDARSGNGKRGPDFVGVWMSVDHRWLTKMFGTAKTITDQSVIRIEPRSK